MVLRLAAGDDDAGAWPCKIAAAWARGRHGFGFVEQASSGVPHVFGDVEEIADDGDGDSPGGRPVRESAGSGPCSHRPARSRSRTVRVAAVGLSEDGGRHGCIGGLATDTGSARRVTVG